MGVLRTFDIVLVVVMMVVAALTYTVKNDAQRRINEIARLEQQIADEKDTIRLLEAEWGLYTQPIRIMRLAEIYNDQLQLQPTEPEQMTRLDQIPEKLPDQIQKLIDNSDALLAEGDDISLDEIMTGSVQ